MKTGIIAAALALSVLPVRADPAAKSAHATAAAIASAVVASLRDSTNGPADLGLQSTAGDVLAYTAYYQDHGYTIDRLEQSYGPQSRLQSLTLLASRRSPSGLGHVRVHVDGKRKTVTTTKDVSVTIDGVSATVDVGGGVTRPASASLPPKR